MSLCGDHSLPVLVVTAIVQNSPVSLTLSGHYIGLNTLMCVCVT